MRRELSLRAGDAVEQRAPCRREARVAVLRTFAGRVGGAAARAGLSRGFSSEGLPRHVRISGLVTVNVSIRKVGYVVMMNNRRLL